MPTIRASAILTTELGALSSDWSEHLPYKEGVGGSSPSAPTANSLVNSHFCRLEKRWPGWSGRACQCLSIGVLLA